MLLQNCGAKMALQICGRFFRPQKSTIHEEENLFMDSEIQVIASVEDIKDRVYWIRGKQVMLDVDLGWQAGILGNSIAADESVINIVYAKI